LNLIRKNKDRNGEMFFHGKQRTIAREVVFSGRALQSGKDSKIVLRPAPENNGIVFSRADIPSRPASRLGEAVLSKAYGRRSTIKAGRYPIQTVEHFLAVLAGFNIDNLFVEVFGEELPALDGSAREYAAGLKNAGLVEQSAARLAVKIDEPITVKGKNGALLSIVPSEKLEISYTIDYPCRSIGRGTAEFEINEEVFFKEIAPARTFCMKKEAELLLRAGFGKGATKENTLVMDEDGPVGTELRFPNEPLRHKVLDLIGDLYILGVPIIGKIKAERSGHRLNGALVAKLNERYLSSANERNIFDKIKRIFEGFNKESKNGKQNA